MSANPNKPNEIAKHIQESMVKKGGSNPKPATPKPVNVVPPPQKPPKENGQR
jgi:hypothetical protein